MPGAGALVRRQRRMSDWLLLRGLGREARHWGDFPDRLRDRCGGEVTCLDFPGNGIRCRERSEATVDAMADFCHREAGAGRPWNVLAMSLGAMVSVAWATRHPEDLTSATLINTSLRPFSPLIHRLRPANYVRILSMLLRPGNAARVEGAILDMTSRLARSDGRGEAAVEAWCRYRLENPVTAANVLRQLAAAARFSGPQAAPGLPLRLLASRGDSLVDPRCSARLAAAWGVPVQWHDTAGHDLPLDDPEWVIARVVEAPARAGGGDSAFVRYGAA